jgi:colanic acid/amylovoran biosynthesis protein
LEKKMKILVADTCTLNAGDAAILFGAAKTLRLAFGDDIEIALLDQHAGVARKVYPDLDIRPMGWTLRSLVERLQYRVRGLFPAKSAPDATLPQSLRDNLSDYKSADLIVFAGGTYLVEHYDMNPHLRQLETAISSGVPVVMFTQSLGPFTWPNVIKRLRRALPHVRLALLRDPVSEGHIKTLGATPQAFRVVSDAAFSLADVDRLRASAARTFPAAPKVAISVRDWSYYRSGSVDAQHTQYRDGVVSLTEHLIRAHGAEVTFISTCQGVPEYRTDDSRLAKEIAGLVAEDIRAKVSVDVDYHDPRQLLEDLSRFDLVVATRMHMAILSLAAGTPVLPIAYEFKTRELFRGLGFEDWVVDIEGVSPSAMPALADKVIAALPGRRAELMESVVKQHQSALSVVADLRKVLPS